jgi:hypothetical protein
MNSNIPINFIRYLKHLLSIIRIHLFRKFLKDPDLLIYNRFLSDKLESMLQETVMTVLSFTHYELRCRSSCCTLTSEYKHNMCDFTTSEFVSCCAFMSDVFILFVFKNMPEI